MQFFAGCYVSDQCKCNLKLSTIEKDSTNELIVGKDDVLSVKFSLSNRGADPAYGTNISFSLPFNLPLIRSEKVHCSSHFTEVSGTFNI